MPRRIGHGAGNERKHAAGTVAGHYRELVANEIKVDGERAIPVWHRRCGESPGSEEQRNLPPVVLHRRGREAVGHSEILVVRVTLAVTQAIYSKLGMPPGRLRRCHEKET